MGCCGYEDEGLEEKGRWGLRFRQLLIGKHALVFCVREHDLPLLEYAFQLLFF